LKLRLNEINKMIQSEIEVLARQPTETGDGKNSRFDLTFPLRASAGPGKLNSSTALVASSDENVQRDLAEMIVQCGLAACVAFTVRESKKILDRQKVSLVVCDESLIDGKYQDILSETVRLRLKTPVIVVSPTGDWPDYLKAISAGAFDYLAYPPIPGDLPRTIRDALTPRRASDFQDTTTKFLSSSRGGMP
jgi:DNA-binding NtrC family response regulator